jgi:hypothetical protein
MRRRIWAAPLTAAVAAAGVAAAYRRRRSSTADARPHVIAVFRPLDEVAANLPDRLTGIAEVRLEAAPGDRGTWIHARPRGGDGDVRRALRETRSLLEVGDVLEPGIATTEPTPLNRPLRELTAHGRQGGRL